FKGRPSRAIRHAIEIGPHIDYPLLRERPGGDHERRARSASLLLSLSLVAAAAAVADLWSCNLGLLLRDRLTADASQRHPGSVVVRRQPEQH
ncbi:MAG: hypothetical protein PVG53_08010, partial [Holophagae bacterium]